MKHRVFVLLLASIMMNWLSPALAVEPNNSFATATILGSGVRSVSDNLTAGIVATPDTLLAVRNASGVITQVDDNGSLLGNGFASGVMGAPINGTSLSFSVSGVGDTGFTGAHNETGFFDVRIDVFDSNGTQVLRTFSEPSNLQPGASLDFSLDGDLSWSGGTYSADIDNTIGEPVGGDVDYYSFIDLPAGAEFWLSVFEQTLDTKALVYQYDETESIIDTNVFSGSTDVPDIDGVVPSSGKLTFAITGENDFNPQIPGPDGGHDDDGTYQLFLVVNVDSGIPADFDNNGLVDDVDLDLWEINFGATSTADADEDEDSDGADFLIWQMQLGSSTPAVAATSIPEPSSTMLSLIGLRLFLRPQRMTRGFF